MIHYLYIKVPSKQDWETLFDAHLAEYFTEVDVIGTILHETGLMQETSEGAVPVMEAVPGYHVNLVLHAEEVPTALFPYLVNPVQPKRVFYGNYTLSAPEVLPDDGDTVVLPRSIGQSFAREALAEVEKWHVEKKRAKAEQEKKEKEVKVHDLNLEIIPVRVEVEVLQEVSAPTLSDKEMELAVKRAERDTAKADLDKNTPK